MWKNLYQKTMYEAYKSKQHLGYKVIDFDNMFAVLWNNQNIPYYNIVHCDMLGKKELDLLKKEIPNTFLCIASNTPISEELGLKIGKPSYPMILKADDKLNFDTKFEVKRVSNHEMLVQFCEVASEVFNLTNDVDELIKSFANETNLDNCFKYVGYIDNEPVGSLEVSEGIDGAYISWGAVKKEYRRRGMYRAMLAHAINHEIDRGFKTILLCSSQMAIDVYAKMGFKTLAERNNYVLEN